MFETVKIIFITKGEKKEFQVPAGTTVLEAAHQNNIDLEGACEGSLACSTCHVILDQQFYNKLSPASEDEEDMLDLAFGLTPTSRLGCQIILTKELDGLTLTVPEETRNVSINNN
ncbi:MAG: 2Fe-2S ferredoxin [Alphaproteobacteria bacterium RIFCSPLOWO2_01_FULL_40_26]|nr:MAG: 2Fe-2S ferredoxin [Alphaproteobacteria bacterium RIFCSPHIGHO2_02_FULL_40_34]OFW94547.1 MAG: 2Fe-2S ferredoxin [Alphaproteobacteria bacterium RIFCSPLOWO2_01_FULL_40_26]OFX10296.1 MAG: 2Fe-2S ferredoxin [Alphaproteobacteria bacterium RIFCSPLOWO2_02_FULL_40_19]OFX11897.1 MAG: 2Fe-2S ferredoxin [Alphaproteobacteria bacterium RIFCSPLOWO2_12_FULL_40_11]